MYVVGEDRSSKLEVLPGSPAEYAGVHSGDRVTAINDQPLKRIEDMRAAWSQLKSDRDLRLSLGRDGRQLEVTFPGELIQGLRQAWSSDIE